MKNFNLEPGFTDYHTLINSLEAFALLTRKEKAKLASAITLLTFERHDVLFKQSMPSDHIVYIVNGLIKVFSGGRARRIICIKIAGPGTFAALSSAFSSNVYRHSAAAVEPTVALMIRKETLKDIMSQNGRFSIMILSLMGKEIIELSDKLVTFSVKQLPGKVADLLRHFSDDVFKSNEFRISLTRQEMAELIGTTKESLIRTLNEFKNDKIIDLDGKNIKILSPDLVKVLSEIG